VTTLLRAAPYRAGRFVPIRGAAPFGLDTHRRGNRPRGPTPGSWHADSGPAGKQCRILVVDDNDGFREALAARLEEFPGAVVEQAAGGSAALTKVRENGGFDLVFLDVAMPGLDGPAVYRRMRQAGIRCRIVLMSMHNNDVNQARARELGTRLLDKMTLPDVLGEILLTCGDDGTP
jgi:CheY-like chemotaxis protein